MGKKLQSKEKPRWEITLETLKIIENMQIQGTQLKTQMGNLNIKQTQLKNTAKK